MAFEFAEDNTEAPPVGTDEIATIAKDIDIFAGWLKRLENPDPVLRTEAGGKGLRLYDEVDRDPHAGSVLQQRALAVVGKEWQIVPAKSARKQGRPASTSQEQVVADFVSSVLENCNFDQARQEILKALLYGYYVAETIWKTDGKTITIKKIIGKHPRRFVFTPERELRLLTPANMIDGEAVPDRKFVQFTYGDSDNPYGRGLGQKLWWPVWFKKNGIKFWLIFLEKFGMPTVKGKYPAGADKTQKQALNDAIEAIQTETGLTFPDSMDVEFLEASRAGTASYEQLCDYMDRQISKAVLGQTASTEGTPGKLGNEKAQGDVRQELIEADADLLDGCLDESLIHWIVDYNFPQVAEYPKIKTLAAPKPDLTQQSLIDKTLAVDIGLPIGTAYFYETYGIPEPEDGEELVNVPPKAQPFGSAQDRPGFPGAPVLPGSSPVLPAQAGTQKNGKQFAEGKSVHGELVEPLDAADVVTNGMAVQAMNVTDEIYMAPLKRLAEAAKDMDDLRDRILDLWGAMDPGTLGVIMAQGMMLAEMAGRYEAAAGKKKALNSPRLV